MTQTDPASLHRAHLDLRAAEPGKRARDIAAALGVPEAALVAACCGQADGPLRAERLRGDDFPALLRAMPSLGPVKAITRNETVVLETEGTYGAVEFFGQMGQSVSSIDLRIFSSRWRHAFVLTEQTRRGERQSLQFFDAHGDAIHKDYLLPGTDREAFASLVKNFHTDDQSPALAAEPRPAAAVTRPDAEVDAAGLREAWRGLRDTHEFFGLLRRFGVTRTQALRLAGDEFARPLPASSLERLLRAASAGEVPFMIFVGNPGLIQIYTGLARRVVTMDGWLNLLDPEVNLHARPEGIDSAWLVRKPTTDGIVTALEFYDRDGEQVILLTGKRKPGQAELPAWRSLAEGLAAPAAASAGAAAAQNV